MGNKIGGGNLTSPVKRVGTARRIRGLGGDVASSRWSTCNALPKTCDDGYRHAYGCLEGVLLHVILHTICR